MELLRSRYSDVISQGNQWSRPVVGLGRGLSFLKNTILELGNYTAKPEL